MGKITLSGPVPPDDPKFPGGVDVFIRPSGGQSTMPAAKTGTASLAVSRSSARLSPAELESLRKETAESMAWMRAELKGKTSATAKKKGKP